jgi:hypothetical protein
MRESAKTAREHLADNYTSNRDTGGQDETTGWLAAFLGPGPRWSTDVHQAREAAGISEKKLKLAKKRLNVESARAEADGPWFMRLPQHAGQVPEGTDAGTGEGQEAKKSPFSDPATSPKESGNEPTTPTQSLGTTRPAAGAPGRTPHRPLPLQDPTANTTLAGQDGGTDFETLKTRLREALRRTS